MEKNRSHRKVMRPLQQDGPNAKREIRDLVNKPYSRTTKVLGKAVLAAWQRAMHVSDVDIQQYKARRIDVQVGEAILAGCKSIDSIAKFCGAATDTIANVLRNQVAMAWMSRQVYTLFQNRTAVIDATLYHRAVGGDLAAIKMFYERMDRLPKQKQDINVTYSGGIDVRGISDDELKKIVQEKRRMLPAEFKVINDVTAEDPERTGD